MSTNLYPFLSKREILEKIESEPAFAGECVAILQDRYDRRRPGESAAGWMASHASTATKLAARLASGEATEKDRAEAVKVASRYSKQLARVFRERELAAHPELGAQAAVFGIGRGGSGIALARQVMPTPGASEERPGEQPAPTPKRRGRPKGSKNKPKTDQLSRRRRTRG
jgi:hypothetical protein